MDIAASRVAAPHVVEKFDVVEHFRPGVVAGGRGMQVGLPMAKSLGPHKLFALELRISGFSASGQSTGLPRKPRESSERAGGSGGRSERVTLKLAVRI